MLREESAYRKCQNKPNCGKGKISADDFFAVCDADCQLGYMESNTNSTSVSYTFGATHGYQHGTG